MVSVFDVDNMNTRLNMYVPEGEKLLVAVKAVGTEMIVRQCFSHAKPQRQEVLVRCDDPQCFVLDVSRVKYATHDIYIGITENYLLFSECEDYKHFWDFKPAVQGQFEPLEVTEDVSLLGFGHAQAFTDVTKFESKKGLLGMVKFKIQFKNGSSFSFFIPKKAGIGKGMPNHKENMEKIVERLNRLQK